MGAKIALGSLKWYSLALPASQEGAYVRGRADIRAVPA